jgi:2-methylcitrate dehydratase PrpD
MKQNHTDLTHTIAQFAVQTRNEDIPAELLYHAKIAFLDWIGVTYAGNSDPLVEKLIRYADLMGGHPLANLVGLGCKKSLSQAALINGAASHALDYDDTLMTYVGHPSVVLFPSLLALSQWQGRSGLEFLNAYIVGIETASAIGAVAGMEHYMAGWHATSTIGHLASAAACSKLLELSEEKTLNALGVAGTLACGLKRSFGTMCKPFHAGRASQAGIMATLLADDGFTAAPDILEAPLGFLHVFSRDINPDAIQNLGSTWTLPKLAQKYHASCHGTHSAIDAALAIVSENRLAPDDINAIRVHTSKLCIDAAGIKKPATGLEGKFSIVYCVANALLRETTGVRAFTEKMVLDPGVRAFMEKLTIHIDKAMSPLGAMVQITTNEGRTFECQTDIVRDIPGIEIKREKIKNKFIDLVAPVIGEEQANLILDKVSRIESLDDLKPFAESL